MTTLRAAFRRFWIEARSDDCKTAWIEEEHRWSRNGEVALDWSDLGNRARTTSHRREVAHVFWLRVLESSSSS